MLISVVTDQRNIGAHLLHVSGLGDKRALASVNKNDRQLDNDLVVKESFSRVGIKHRFREWLTAERVVVWQKNLSQLQVKAVKFIVCQSLIAVKCLLTMLEPYSRWPKLPIVAYISPSSCSPISSLSEIG